MRLAPGLCACTTQNERTGGHPAHHAPHHILQVASAFRIRRKPTSSGRNYGAGVSVASQATDVQPTAGGLLPRIRLAVSSPPRARAQFLCVGDERVPSRPRPRRRPWTTHLGAGEAAGGSAESSTRDDCSDVSTEPPEKPAP